MDDADATRWHKTFDLDGGGIAIRMAAIALSRVPLDGENTMSASLFSLNQSLHETN